MNTTRRGSSGPDVLALQKALLAHGFNPGAADGDFGGGTEAALIAFQMSEGLLADGIAGPRSQTALGLSDDPALPDALQFVTVQVASAMFPLTPLGPIKANLPPVLWALDARELRDRSMALMALSTIRAETESFQPVAEGPSRFNTSPAGPPFDLYDNRRDLGNQGAPDGARYRGRGFVQLTGRFNYRQYGPRLSDPADLETNPDLAADPKVAAELLALFLGDRELQIKDALMHGNLMAARRLVNGGSHGLDRFSDAYARGDALLPRQI
ncbi:MAG: peptidoglycan-binding protein [Burkholderiales bacterium]|nr:peptidoglycan-binding protein [Burkholderiales bacterium]MDE2397650.1 peptidoglycan-binding protein [Burkholderiales bacterium]MDE2452219.1 peptidoglycan-binding protein [Burkholderiales bacterium]